MSRFLCLPRVVFLVPLSLKGEDVFRVFALCKLISSGSLPSVNRRPGRFPHQMNPGLQLYLLPYLFGFVFFLFLAPGGL